jgi:hypothetical protein
VDFAARTEDAHTGITPAFLAERRHESFPSLQCSGEKVIEILSLRQTLPGPERGKENPDDLKIFFRPRASVLSSAANLGEGPKVSSNIFFQVPVPKVIFELPSV